MLLKRVLKKISNISPGNINHRNVLGDSGAIAVKLEKLVGLIFSSFNSCASLPSVSNRQQKAVLMPKYNL